MSRDETALIAGSIMLRDNVHVCISPRTSPARVKFRVVPTRGSFLNLWEMPGRPLERKWLARAQVPDATGNGLANASSGPPKKEQGNSRETKGETVLQIELHK